MMKLTATVLAAVLLASACTASGPPPSVPDLAARGTTLTTATLTRQDLANKVSLSAKVTMNPIFGLVAPMDGQIRFVDVKPPNGTPIKPTKVATVSARGKQPATLEVPAGATFAGRLVDDKSTVTTGMPVVSAKYVGYGIVADIDGADAYKLSDQLGTVQAQVKNGPGPFPCTVLGTIAALPAGTIPEPPAPPAPPQDQQQQVPGALQPVPPPAQPDSGNGDQGGSEPTGLRLVCTAPADVKLINGAAATIEVITARASQVLVAPVEAVAGRQGAGQVDVIGPDGSRQTTQVELGLTDGRMIEIRSGLTGTESLAVPGPNLPDAPGGPNEQGGPGGVIRK
ncbi:MAG TPA: efflux RND transporter periplasmic adaptor subunit [Actinophytocola sp.]|uniref:efflux RND transporter periplasmic adaptor subunit n=1 Tax=Actinophytocola sp. TaxID=1872138 RepID=UPI002DBAA345|nr:efflux RND transporter periplasmic adaptor subunit [Actinophytocola sp.]HEU5474522.1 efflux RND transporter periplasmic adaptor subunit [Actinophytocola sp.]